MFLEASNVLLVALCWVRKHVTLAPVPRAFASSSVRSIHPFPLLTHLRFHPSLFIPIHSIHTSTNNNGDLCCVLPQSSGSSHHHPHPPLLDLTPGLPHHSQSFHIIYPTSTFSLALLLPVAARFLRSFPTCWPPALDIPFLSLIILLF